MDGRGSCGGHRRAAELTPPSSESGVFSRTFVNSLFDLPCGGCEQTEGWKKKKKKKNRRAKMLERRGMNNLLYMGGDEGGGEGREGGRDFCFPVPQRRLGRHLDVCCGCEVTAMLTINKKKTQ